MTISILTENEKAVNVHTFGPFTENENEFRSAFSLMTSFTIHVIRSSLKVIDHSDFPTDLGLHRAAERNRAWYVPLHRYN